VSLAFAIGHRDLAVPLQRGAYTAICGLILSSLAAPLYERYGPAEPSPMSWAMLAGGAVIMGLVTALVVNSNTWWLVGVGPLELTLRQRFTSFLYFFLYYIIWGILWLQVLGRKVVSLELPEEGEKYVQRISVEKAGEVRVLRASDLSHIEAEGDYVALTTGEGTWLKIGTISSFEEGLDPALFLRIHRSRIVNRLKVKKVTKAARGRFDFEMEGGTVLSSAPGKRQAILEALPELI
jgi:hypothetical protein